MTSSINLPPAVIDSEVITLIPWIDHRVDATGHDPRSTYVEQFWLGTLGPSTTWFLRHCANRLDDAGSTAVNLREIANTLGIGHEGGSRSAMSKTVARACRFRAARSVGSATLAVRLRLPQLSYRQVQRLPEPTQRRHEEFLAVNLSRDEVCRQQSRVRRLAVCLIECGDSFEQTERLLARMSYHPAIVAEAVRWAWNLHHGRSSPEAA
ncbi:MAG: hypothetical protein F4Y05_03995 [Acidimicrobiaceae bacterium]|nr:hypothetical protein [Acidimicrobiaceae bacterium]MYE08748.1 hypothetical protein [Acidimicrobiaceae bacterium]MYI36531.1 hypothetical protein [Acidimicrobiaceae bacterium]